MNRIQKIRKADMKVLVVLTVIAVIVIVLIIVAFGAAVRYAFANSEMNRDRSGEYTKLTVNGVICVKIINSCPNVRSEPVAADSAAYGTNSFGKTTKTNFTFEVSKVYTMTKALDNNGKYIGIKVDDVLGCLEGKEWFPKGIKKDPDGIVWINERYVELLL